MREGLLWSDIPRYGSFHTRQGGQEDEPAPDGLRDIHLRLGSAEAP